MNTGIVVLALLGIFVNVVNGNWNKFAVEYLIEMGKKIEAYVRLNTQFRNGIFPPELFTDNMKYLNAEYKGKCSEADIQYICDVDEEKTTDLTERVRLIDLGKVKEKGHRFTTHVYIQLACKLLKNWINQVKST